jgi:hypothetical protein
MEKFCTVPKGLRVGEDGDAHYVHCGRSAVCKVGSWYVCAGHKKHYTDINKWPAEPLKGETGNETDES